MNLFEKAETGYNVWKTDRYTEDFWRRPSLGNDNQVIYPPETTSIDPQAKVMANSILYGKGTLCGILVLVAVVMGVVVYKKCNGKKQ
jgi:hypothetical protein